MELLPDPVAFIAGRTTEQFMKSLHSFDNKVPIFSDLPLTHGWEELKRGGVASLMH